MRGRHLVNGRTRRGALLATFTAVLALGAVTPASAASTAARRPAPLTILVTNDDGVAAPGIDALVEALRADRRNRVVVVAPADNKSGSGGRSTPGGAPGGPATTASGYAATAVQGYPVDAVDYAFDVQKVAPDVVISGANFGQNLGEIVEVSGTVGAAREGARRGVPALAVSAQLGRPDFPTSARLTLDWLRAHRTALAKARRTARAPLTEIDSINVPTCPDGTIRGVFPTTLAPKGTPDLANSTSTCTAPAGPPANDAAAFNAGYASLTKVPVPAG